MNERVRELRRKLNLTLEEFGNRIGIKKNSLSQIENGKNNLTEQNIRFICREFNVNEEWLRTGIGEMYKSLSREEEIASMTAMLFKEENDAFKYRLIKALCNMDEKGWDYLERLLDDITKKD